jgi:hypothetical protein
MFSPMIHLVLSGMTDPAKHRAENELFHLYHQPELRSLPEIRIPDLLSCPGVAGAWIFAADEFFTPPWDDGRTNWSFADGNSRAAQPQPQRMQILYLDDDPLQVMSDIQERDAALRKAGRLRDTSDAEDVLLTSPLRAIIAWQWDWFKSS